MTNVVMLSVMVQGAVKARLHHGKNRSKLVHFEKQNKIIFTLNTLAYSGFRHGENTSLVCS